LDLDEGDILIPSDLGSCSKTEIEVPPSFNDNGGSVLCVDKTGFLVARFGAGNVQVLGSSGICQSMPNLPETRYGGGMAYIGGKLISYGGYDGKSHLRNTWEFRPLSNSWKEREKDSMTSGEREESTTFGDGVVSLLSNGTKLAQFYSHYNWAVHSFNPSAPWPSWSSARLPNTNDGLPCVVAVGHFNIIIVREKVYKHHPTRNTYTQMADLPIASTFNRASLLDRPTGTGIVVVHELGRVSFCLLEMLDKPAGWKSMPSIPTENYVPKIIGLVQGHLMVFGHSNEKHLFERKSGAEEKSALVSFQWEESNMMWIPAPTFELNSSDLNYNYAPYTSAPKDVLSSCYSQFFGTSNIQLIMKSSNE
jgi:hypothetical protein